MDALDQLKVLTPTISVGLLTADMMNLSAELELIESAGVQLLHFDVMDGRFWPQITMGPAFVHSIKTPMLKDVHLLIERPENHIAAFAQAGADIITFAAESCGDLRQTLETLQGMPNFNDPEKRILGGLSLKPETELSIIHPVIDMLDIILLLAVSPDAPGQNFLDDIPGKIRQLRAIKEDLMIFVDGGIKKNNIGKVAAMGPDVIITGSAVFDGKTPKENAEFMLKLI